MDPQNPVETLRERGGLRSFLLADARTEREVVLAAMLVEIGAVPEATEAELELLATRLAQVTAGRRYSLRAVRPG